MCARREHSRTVTESGEEKGKCKEKNSNKEGVEEEKDEEKENEEIGAYFCLEPNVAGLEERIIQSKRAPIDGQTSSGKGTAKNSKKLHA